MADPYRTAATASCPACATALLTDAADGVRPCPRGCGHWASSGVIDKLWGDVVDRPSDPRMSWRGRAPFPCVVCAAVTKRHMHEQCTWYRCRDHGVWFHRDSRARFEVIFTGAIATHRAGLAQVDVVCALFERVRAGDPEALATLARRWVALERQIGRRHTPPASVEGSGVAEVAGAAVLGALGVIGFDD